MFATSSPAQRRELQHTLEELKGLVPNIRSDHGLDKHQVLFLMVWLDIADIMLTRNMVGSGKKWTEKAILKCLNAAPNCRRERH